MSARRTPWLGALLTLILSLTVVWSAQAAPSGILAGVVWLDQRTDHRNIQIYLDGAPFTLTSPTGEFALAVADGPATLRAKHPGYLSRTYHFNPQAPSVFSTLPTTRLRLGDADGDDDVDIGDLLIVSSAYGTVPPQDGRADLNGDGVVDAIDLDGVIKNYGLRGPLPWLDENTPVTATPTASPAPPTGTPTASPPPAASPTMTLTPTITQTPLSRPTLISTPRPLRTPTPTTANPP